MELNKAITLNNQGAKHFLEKEYEKAEQCYLEAFEINPKNVSVLNNLGLFYHQQKDYEKALSYFDLAISHEEKPNFRVNAGNSLVMLNKPDKAKEQYLKATKLDPRHIGAWVSLAKLCTHLGELEDAVLFWKKLMRYTAKEEYILELAKVYMLKKQFNVAVSLLYERIPNPNNPEIWFQIGRGEFLLKNHGMAEDALKKALAECPDQVEYRYYLAINYLSMGQIEGGLYHINMILKLQPDNYQILTEKGIILCGLHEYDNALKLFEKALSIQPEYDKAIHYKKLISNQTS
ncbi:tetratricopeptide repeat protein [Echinicola jeungdonensis]|uniref:Tetratricopeptide repeat protein n=1 Tax=Echinicola jeungdonensis TaxID=709343 RepID=A0ABV5J7B4_9BACT|nr:tetratricopeptide repeat protein [Echinicola jeungdonensis]MDN3670809.1 tetratricopeptide repeat protein [Echinicola jeungdonensis]